MREKIKRLLESLAWSIETHDHEPILSSDDQVVLCFNPEDVDLFLDIVLGYSQPPLVKAA